MSGIRILPVTVALTGLLSCDASMVYDAFITNEDGMWHWSEPAEFKVDISDTTSLHNIYLQVRHTVEYPMRNLYMFVHLEGPSGRQLTDTVNMVLAAPDGSWIGRGAGNLRELSLLYRKNTKFSEQGTYLFILEQAMRKPELPVRDLGIRIEKTSP